MKTMRAIKALFVVSALYDGLLGAIFLLAGNSLFQRLGVMPPNHPGYVQFPAALLIVFAIMFVVIAMDPVKNRNLIPYGFLLKVSYCSVILFHWLTTGLPDMWKPFFIYDFAFIAAYIWAWIALGKEKTN